MEVVEYPVGVGYAGRRLEERCGGAAAGRIQRLRLGRPYAHMHFACSLRGLPQCTGQDGPPPGVPQLRPQTFILCAEFIMLTLDCGESRVVGNEERGEGLELACFQMLSESVSRKDRRTPSGTLRARDQRTGTAPAMRSGTWRGCLSG